MKVLIDFDNIPIAITRQGPAHLADLIFTSLVAKVPAGCDSLELRLYSGWDENGSLTKRAQSLSALLRTIFPRQFRSLHTTPPTPMMVRAVLALSLECAPRTPLSRTLRTYPFVRQVSCEQALLDACGTGDCPIRGIGIFLTMGTCPEVHCTTTRTQLLSVTEQKLVDSMLTADLVHLAHSGEKTIAVLSSDDDMWPGIITAIHAGVHLYHLQTKNLKANPRYLHVANGKYVPVEF